MKKPQKIIILVLTTLILLLPQLAFAQTATTAGNDALVGVFKLLNVILSLLQAILWPILLLIGSLLNNDLIFSGGMQTMLLNLWSTIRDFVNIMFVLVLIGVAIMNIFGAGGQKYHVFGMLGKIAIGLIAVNFSFLACKVVLDVVNVTTAAIFALPLAQSSLALSSADVSQPAVKLDEMCNRFVKYTNSSTSGTINATPDLYGFCQKDKSDPNKIVVSDWGKKFFSSFNSRNVALIMAVQFMNINTLDSVKNMVDLKQPNGSAADAIKNLSVNTLFSVVFYVIYGAAFVAMFIVLLFRIVVLWLSIALMPISALTKVFGFNNKEEPLSLFMANAFSPIYFALVLTLGSIIINELKNFSPAGIASTNLATMGTLAPGMSTLQDLLAGAACTMFIWKTVKLAVEKSGQGANIATNFLNTVGKFGEGAAKLPLTMPLIPTQGGFKSPTDIYKSATQKFAAPAAAVTAAVGGADLAARHLAELNKVNNQNDFRKTFAKIIEETPKDQQLSEDVRKKLAELIPQYGKDLVLPGKYKNDRNKFIEALKAGTATTEELKELQRLNQNKLQYDVKNDPDYKEAQKELTKAKTIPGSSTDNGMKTALQDLEKALKEFERADSMNRPDKKKQLDLKVKIVKQLNAAKQTVETDLKAMGYQNQATPPTPEQKKKIKESFERIKSQLSSSGMANPDDSAKQLLIEQMKTNGIRVNNLPQLVTDIINSP